MNEWIFLAVLAVLFWAFIFWIARWVESTDRAMEWVDEQYRLIDEEFNKNDGNPVGSLPYQWRGLGPLSWKEARRMVARHRQFREQAAAERAASKSNNKETPQ